MDTLSYSEELALVRPNSRFKASLRICSRTSPYEETEAASILHEQELAYYRKLRFDRKRSFVLGRYCAKRAIAGYAGAEHFRPTQIWVQQGVFHQPVVMLQRAAEPIQVTITHCGDLAAAIAFPEVHPMGIDLEKIDSNHAGAIESQITPLEKNILHGLSFEYETALTMLWTSKESLSKILKTGLMTPFSVYEINQVEIKPNCMIASYTNFAQYSTLSFVLGRYMISITHPKRTGFKVNIPEIQRLFQASG
ncbi:4'-phosphopantetheinyl transferase family protein [Paenibacillus hamazuiensis]|uniref:4'-phosphopantetheinyl transferase family protein n=1 Tax=Paenibacillus hamazuiensis TaxID=2936508 RepID=UPI0020106302|nr:4'-phosphopantetheinyl transferase superfamily protein [Paenibacillus hamazuiensis]